MVNNSTNINKTNNCLSSRSLNIKILWHNYVDKNPGPSLQQAQKCDRVKLFNGITTPHLLPVLIIGSIFYLKFQVYLHIIYETIRRWMVHGYYTTKYSTM